MACTPFWYGSRPHTVVAVFPDVDGVAVRVDQQLSDHVWRDVCELRFTWSGFAQFAQDACQIVADPRAAMERITDPATSLPKYV